MTVKLVPDTIHLVLDDAVRAHAELMRYFYPRHPFNYIGDLSRDSYNNLCEELYAIDSSDTAYTIIRNAWEAFNRYAYQREAIAF